MTSEADLVHLRRCVELATQALEEGNSPFASVLVNAEGTCLAEDYNRSGSGDPTRHPEFELSRWAARNLAPVDRSSATVYTSGEHCPMCASAHAMVGLGRIVYIASSRDFERCLDEHGLPSGPVANLSILEIAPTLPVEGPVPELRQDVLALYHRSCELRR